MHNLLETYLEQLAQSLHSLPADQREAELREVRAHLEFLAAYHLENGQSPEESMRSAIHQFGTPAIIGHDLRRAWRRAHNRARRRALKRNFRVVVGTRQGKAVVNWSGALSLVALVVLLNVAMTGVLSFVLTHDFFYLMSGLTFGIPMQLGAIVGVGIKRALQMPPQQLTPLD